MRREAFGKSILYLHYPETTTLMNGLDVRTKGGEVFGV
jgi:hypothetical protein